MRCVKPFVSRMGAFGCGQCLPCRVTKRRTWAHRIMLEATEHARSSFVTLTYAKDRRSLEPVDLQLWLKKFRRAISPHKIRYFAVGEYGEASWRPHYHVALFGWPSCLFGKSSPLKGGCQCHACSVVRQTWGFGHVMVGRLELKSSQYIAGYCMKKMTHSSDTRLHGRHPEFTRMSLNKGIGATALHNVASEILRLGLEDRDVPIGLRHGKTIMPLGKYLRRELRKMIGKNEKAPPETVQKLANQMQILRAYAWQNDRSVSSVFEELFLPLENQIAGRLTLNRTHQNETL